MPPLPDRGPLFSPLEYAPGFLVYALHFPYGLWLALKHRSAGLPSLANPSIVTGGIAGESKTALSKLVGPVGTAYFAPFVSVRADAGNEEVTTKLAQASITYPLVAKPDIGRNGRGVKIVTSPSMLAAHLASFPPRTLMVLQRYITDEGEAGVFYVRKPSEQRGKITSLTLKYFPKVIGDGRSTLRELILRDERAAKISSIYFRRHKRELERVIPEGESYQLVSVGNHVRGALFVNGAPYITPELTEVFDRIAKDIKEFHFGRFDVRFADINAFSKGRDFSIIEYNGVSSEPTHVWDRRTSMWKTYRQMLSHWRYTFEIGAEMRAKGHVPDTFFSLVKAWREEEALIQQYPDEE